MNYPLTAGVPRETSLRDVAAAAGVSYSTASLALNPRSRWAYKIPAATRRRVEVVAEQLGYRARRVVRHSPLSASARAIMHEVARHVPLMRSLGLRDCRDPHRADDISQEACLKLAKFSHRFDSHDVQRMCCLFVRFAARREFARRRKHELSPANLEAMARHHPPTRCHDFEAMERRELLDQLLATIPPRDELLIRMRYLESRDWPTIAAALGITRKSCECRASLMMNRLRLADRPDAGRNAPRDVS